MTSTRPLASIVIPTHNRQEQLRLSLEALANQSISWQDFEVVVAADGCTDGTMEMLAEYRPRYQLKTLALQKEGPAAARNAGATASKGQVIIFMDDDIEVAPTFVAAHLRAHLDGDDRVVIGYLPPVLATQGGLFSIVLRNWWEDLFAKMCQQGHRFAYTDLLSGNFSLPARLFARLGGFNPSLSCHEDYEFGMRLIQAGIPFSFVPEALGYHQEKTEINRAMRRKYEEGEADVILGRLYPELRQVLLMSNILRNHRLTMRVISFLAFRIPGLGTILMRLIQLCLPILEWFRLRLFWRLTLNGLMLYWYCRGVAREMRSLDAVKTFLAEPVPPRTSLDLELDLAQGLEAAERMLSQARPASVTIRYGPHLVGWIPAEPGTEPLRGAHLRRLLTMELLPSTKRLLVVAGGESLFGTE